MLLETKRSTRDSSHGAQLQVQSMLLGLSLDAPAQPQYQTHSQSSTKARRKATVSWSDEFRHHVLHCNDKKKKNNNNHNTTIPRPAHTRTTSSAITELVDAIDDELNESGSDNHSRGTMQSQSCIQCSIQLDDVFSQQSSSAGLNLDHPSVQTPRTSVSSTSNNQHTRQRRATTTDISTSINLSNRSRHGQLLSQTSSGASSFPSQTERPHSSDASMQLHSSGSTCSPSISLSTRRSSVTWEKQIRQAMMVHGKKKDMNTSIQQQPQPQQHDGNRVSTFVKLSKYSRTVSNLTTSSGGPLRQYTSMSLSSVGPSMSTSSAASLDFSITDSIDAGTDHFHRNGNDYPDEHADHDDDKDDDDDDDDNNDDSDDQSPDSADNPLDGPGWSTQSAPTMLELQLHQQHNSVLSTVVDASTIGQKQTDNQHDHDQTKDRIKTVTIIPPAVTGTRSRTALMSRGMSTSILSTTYSSTGGLDEFGRQRQQRQLPSRGLGGLYRHKSTNSLSTFAIARNHDASKTLIGYQRLQVEWEELQAQQQAVGQAHAEWHEEAKTKLSRKKDMMALREECHETNERLRERKVELMEKIRREKEAVAKEAAEGQEQQQQRQSKDKGSVSDRQEEVTQRVEEQQQQQQQQHGAQGQDSKDKRLDRQSSHSNTSSLSSVSRFSGSTARNNGNSTGIPNNDDDDDDATIMQRLVDLRGSYQRNEKRLSRARQEGKEWQERQGRWNERMKFVSLKTRKMEAQQRIRQLEREIERLRPQRRMSFRTSSARPTTTSKPRTMKRDSLPRHQGKTNSSYTKSNNIDSNIDRNSSSNSSGRYSKTKSRRYSNKSRHDGDRDRDRDRHGVHEQYEQHEQRRQRNQRQASSRSVPNLKDC